MADGNEEIIDGETETIDTETRIEETVGTDSFNFLGTTKVLLGISDESKDAILQIYLDLVEQSILNYCNIFELPSALNYTLCSMTADFYRENEMNTKSGEVVGKVSSITEDGRSVAFTNGSELKASIDDRIYKLKELNSYRKLYRV